MSSIQLNHPNKTMTRKYLCQMRNCVLSLTFALLFRGFSRLIPPMRSTHPENIQIYPDTEFLASHGITVLQDLLFKTFSTLVPGHFLLSPDLWASTPWFLPKHWRRRRRQISRCLGCRLGCSGRFHSWRWRNFGSFGFTCTFSWGPNLPNSRALNCREIGIHS